LWRRLRRVAVPAALLSTVGVVATAVLTGAAAYSLFRPVMARSGAARRRRRLDRCGSRRRLARTLEAEMGGNDPVAIALTIGLIDWIDKPSFTFPDLVLLILRQLGLGLLTGVALGAWRCGSSRG
jgi:cell volume regulation protein A